MSSTYFDFHFHPMFKKNVVKFENSYPTEREDDDLSGLINLNNDIANAIDKSSLHIIGSQSSVDQVNALMHPGPGVDNGFLGVANIMSIEYGFTDVRGLAKGYLKPESRVPIRC